MKKITVLSLVSMLLVTAACSHEPTMSDDMADLQLNNTSSESGSAPAADTVAAEPMSGIDLSPPASPLPPVQRVHRSSRHVKHRTSKKKVAKHKHHGRHSNRNSELARSR